VMMIKRSKQKRMVRKNELMRENKLVMVLHVVTNPVYNMRIIIISV